MLCAAALIFLNVFAFSEGSKEGDSGQAKDGTYMLEIYTFQNGTSTYVQGVALADLINQNSTWLHASAMESPGPNETARLLLSDPEKQTHAIGYVIIQDVLLGLPPFDGPNEDLRGIASYGLVSNCFITNNPSIKTLRDLEGKKVGLGTKPNMPRVDIPLKTFEIMGIDVKSEYLTFGAAVEALVNHKIDALIGGGFARNPDATDWAPNPALAELMARDTINYISFEKKSLLEAKKFLGHELMPGVLTIPAGKYDPEFNKPITLMADYLGWSCHKNLPDRVVKEILRIMMANTSKFADYLPTGAYITPETMAMLDTPEYIHPAAEEFYRENAIPIRQRQ
jgi:TRAP transporter TAXI family solute receptor